MPTYTEVKMFTEGGEHTETVKRLTAGTLTGFTMYNAAGVWEGTQESACVVQWVGEWSRAVEESFRRLAIAVREACKQTTVWVTVTPTALIVIGGDGQGNYFSRHIMDELSDETIEHVDAETGQESF